VAKYSQVVNRLIEEFARLPGIGQKSAERLAYHLLESSREEALALARAIRAVKEEVKHCSLCYNLSETDPCHICSDPARDGSVICVVEQPKDLLAIESSESYRGLYHVLLGHIAPLEDRGPESLTVDKLLERVKPGEVREVIIATNPNLEGDGTALYLAQRLAPTGVKLTRLARGVAAGSSLEYASRAIISDALQGRRTID
jgi:recombination protein RecR